jgi:hypothetical protein
VSALVLEDGHRRTVVSAGAPLQFNGRRYLFACALQRGVLISKEAVAILFAEDTKDHVECPLGDVLHLFEAQDQPNPVSSPAVRAFLTKFVPQCSYTQHIFFTVSSHHSYLSQIGNDTLTREDNPHHQEVTEG